MATCASDGNQGFPVPITGAIGSTDLNFRSIQGSNEIYPSFGTRTTPRSLIEQPSRNSQAEGRRNLIDEGPESTLTYKGQKYSLVEVQVCRPTTGSSWPGTTKGRNTADVAFFFSNFTTSTNIPSTIALIVPLYERESLEDPSQSTPKALTYFQGVLDFSRAAAGTGSNKSTITSLSQVFTDLLNPSYALYSTCLTLRTSAKSTASIQVVTAYFPGGWILPKVLIEGLGDYTYNQENKYAPIYIPESCRGRLPTATSIPPSYSSPAYTSWLENISNWSPYGESFTIPVSVSDPAFTKRFLYVSEGLMARSGGGANQNRLKTTFEYKCMPLDKAKDLDGNYVLLDPATGKRTLKETLESPPSATAAQDLKLTKNDDRLKSLLVFASVIGAIFGFIVVIVGISYLTKFVLRAAGGETVMAVAPPVTSS